MRPKCISATDGHFGGLRDKETTSPSSFVTWCEIEANLAPSITEFLNKICNEVVRKSDLHNFAVMCKIPLHVLDRVEVDYLGDCLTHAKTVVFNWWVGSGLSIGHKVNYIKNAFDEGGRPALFGRIVRDFQDLVKLAKQ